MWVVLLGHRALLFIVGVKGASYLLPPDPGCQDSGTRPGFKQSNLDTVIVVSTSIWLRYRDTWSNPSPGGAWKVLLDEIKV